MSYQAFDWNAVRGRYAGKMSELCNSDSVKIFYYRNKKAEAELYNGGKKSKFLPCAFDSGYVFLIDSQQQEGKWVLKDVLTMQSEGATVFMKDLGEVIKNDKTRNKVNIRRYIKNKQEYYEETVCYKS